MTVLNDAIKQTSQFLSNNNDDITDRYHNRFTVVGLAVFLLVITSKQYFGEPVQCHLTKSAYSDSKNFIHSVCWLNGTNRLKHIEGNNYEMGSKITYYQWITLIIVIQCCLFILPSIIWKFFNRLNGFDLIYVSRNVIKNAYLSYYSNNTNWSKMQKMLEHVSDHLRISIITSKKPSKRYQDNIKASLNGSSYRLPGFELWADKKKEKTEPRVKSKLAFPLYWSYILTKFLYLTNIAAQFLFLSIAFGFRYDKFGIIFLGSLIKSTYTYDEYHFPKRSLCRVETYHLSGMQTLTYLCSLPVNLFNEIFYFVFWFWLIALTVLTLASLLYWLKFAIPTIRRKYVLSLMSMQFKADNCESSYMSKYYFGKDIQNLNDENRFLIEHNGLTLEDNFNLFFMDVCSLDLVLVITLLAMNSNRLVAKDILYTLWIEYLNLDEAHENITRLMNLDRRPLPGLRKTVYQSQRLNPVDEANKSIEQNETFDVVNEQAQE